MIFVFIGQLKDKARGHAFVRANGGEIVDSISGSTTYVVTGSYPSKAEM
jgi:NAD-dependent DNA ligase